MSLTIINKQAEPQVMGMGEMPVGGKRYMRIRKRYSDGSIKEELHPVPETNSPYFWIPSFGFVSKDEMEYLALAQKEKDANPSPEKLEFRARAKERKRTLNQRWRDLCDARGEEQRGTKRFALPDRSFR